MLVIRQEQLEAIGKSRLPEFYAFLIKYMETHFPEKTVELGIDVNEWVESTYEQAKLFGLKTKQEHVKFLNYKCIFGDDFFNNNTFAYEILTSSKSASAKLSDLKQAFMEDLERKQNA